MMKGVSFVILLLFLEAQGSFLDDFRGAIYNINQGFGKLIGDVVTDVKDTLYCTISAVEQVLVLNGFLDKRTLYNQKCKGTEKPKEQSLNFRDGSQSKTVSKIHKHSVIHHKHSSRHITRESEHSIKSVNKTTINVLGNMDQKNDTERLSEISKMLIRESENISKNLTAEIKLLHLNYKSPVETIWNEIKLLNDLRRNSTNITEVNEIDKIFDKVTNKMHLKINSKKILDNQDLDELRKELENNVNDKEKITSEINSKTENQELTKSKENNTLISLNMNKTVINVTTHKRDHQSELQKKPVKQDKSIFSLGLDSLASFFNSVTPSHDDLKNANNIVSESQYAEKLFNNFIKGKHFNFGKR